MPRATLLFAAAVLTVAACAKDPPGTVAPPASTTTSPPPSAGGGGCGELGGACSPEGASCSPQPIGGGWSHALRCSGGRWTELEIAPLPPPHPSTTSPLSRSASGSAHATRSLPKLDASCNADADCVVFDEELADAPPTTYACCGGCTQRAASKTWHERFRAACAAAPPPMCPPMGCAQLPVRAACVAHRCKVVPAGK